MATRSLVVAAVEAALAKHGSHVDTCICGGCPEQVPGCWAAGMCSSCANEDCQHEIVDAPAVLSVPVAMLERWAAAMAEHEKCLTTDCQLRAALSEVRAIQREGK